MCAVQAHFWLLYPSEHSAQPLAFQLWQQPEQMLLQPVPVLLAICNSPHYVTIIQNTFWFRQFQAPFISATSLLVQPQPKSNSVSTGDSRSCDLNTLSIVYLLFQMQLYTQSA